MSKTIDERVVEMRFDNKQFESNVATSMSTLEKLKKSLKLDGAAKGLEGIDNAARKVDMSGLGSGVESVKAKFSALDVVAVTALANITNQAVNTGMQLAKSLSVDQISAGWQKFADKTTSVATLVAQGNAIEDVNAQMSRLNWFTDETSYNFTEMVSNIAKFTATGKGLEESVTAMEGIATWAALSGQNAATASRAMYQLSQAMGAGVMRKEDYKSIQNASMDTDEFRQKCLDAGVALGTLKKTSEDTYESLVKSTGEFSKSQFAEHLTQDLWLTSDVMMKVFNDYSAAVEGIYTAAEEKGMLASEVIDEIYATAEKKGISTDEAIQSLGYSFDSFALKAFEAAQKARTFQDAIDSVKDAVSTGWMNTFELLFGNAEQATELWTDVANQLWDIFASGGERRNEILDDVMVSKWDKLIEKIEDAGGSAEDFESKLKETAREHGVAIDDLIKEYGSLSAVVSAGKLSKSVIIETIKKLAGTFTKTSEAVKVTTDSLEHFQGIVNKVIRGDFGNGVERLNELTEAGENAAAIQELVNKVWERSGHTWSDTTITAEDLAVVIGDLSVEQLESIGYTEEQATALKELAKEAEETGTDIYDLIENLNKPSGRELVFDIIHNSLAALSTVLGTIREAWDEIFSSKRMASGLYSILDALQKFSESLIMTEETADNFKRTLKGLFAILDIIGSVVGGAFNAAFRIFREIVGAVNVDVLEMTGGVGDVIVAFRDWLKTNDIIAKGFDKLVKGAVSVINAIKKLVKAFANIPTVRKALDGISEAFEKFIGSADNMDGALNKTKEWFDTFKESSTVQAALTGIANIYDRVSEAVTKSVTALSKWFAVFKKTEGVKQLVQAVESLVTAFKKLFSGEINANEFARALGTGLANLLTSLPKIALRLAKDFVAGFRNGIADEIGGVISAVVEFCSNLISSFAEALGIHSPSTLTYAIGVFLIAGLVNGIKDSYGDVFGVFQPIVDFIENVFSSLWSYVTDESGNIEWGKIFTGAITIESLVILKQFTTALDKFASAATSFTGLIDAAKGVVTSFGTALTKLSKAMSLNLKADAILKLAIAVGILAASVWLLCQIGAENLGDLAAAVVTIGILAGVLVALAVAVDNMTAASLSITKNGAAIDGLKTGLIQIGLALLMVATVVKMIGGMDPEEADRGMTALLEITIGMITFLGLMGVISLYAKDVSHFGSMMTQMAVALGIMAVVIKMLSRLDPADILIGLIVMQTFAMLCTEMGIANRLAGASGNGKSFLAMAVAMGLMVVVMKMIRRMDPADIAKGIIVMQLFVLLMAEMALVNRLAGTEAAKFGGTITAMAASMLILAGVLLILSKLDDDAVTHGMKVMQHFVLLIAELILVSRLAGKESAKIAGNLLAMSAAIGILAGVCILLGYVEEEDFQKGLRVVTALGLVMAAMIWATRGVQNIKGNLVAMSVAIGVMVAAVVVLSFIDEKDLAGATAAIGSLMLIFGLMTKIAASAQATKSAIGAITVMIVVVGLLATMLWALSALIDDANTALAIAGSLSTLMLAFSASLVIMSAAGPLARAALYGIQVMLGVTFILGLIIAALSNTVGIDSAIKAAASLSILLLSFSVSLSILSASAPLVVQAIPGMQAMLGVTFVLGLVIAALCQIPNVDAAIKVATSLSILLVALSAACLLMAAAATMMAGAMAGAKQILVVLGIMLAIVAVLAVFSAIDPEGTVSVMTTMGEAIGGFIGGIVSGVANAAIGLLPAIGQALSDFMSNAKGFIDIAGQIGPGVILGAGYLTAAILCLTAADFIAGLSSIVTLGQGSLATIGDGLKKFGEGAKATFDVIKDVGPDAVTAASNVADMIQNLSECKIGNIVFLDFGLIKSKLSDFGDAVVGFSDKITGKINPEAVQAAAAAGEMFVALNKSLPKSGGFVQDIIGEQDLEQFSKACKAFANCLIEINAAVSQEGFVLQSEKISQLITAGTQFAELNKALPRAGGIAQDLAGEQDLAAFGKACKAFADCMVDINTAVSQEGFVLQSEKISQLAKAGEQFNDLNTALPRTGGVAQDLAGEQDLDRFGKACKAFAECIVDINAAVGQEGFAVNLEAIESLKQAGLKMNELQDALPKSGGWVQNILGEQDIKDFGGKIEAFGESMVGFSNSVVDVNFDKANAAMTIADTFRKITTDWLDVDTSGLNTFAIAVSKIGAGMKQFGKYVDKIDPEKVSTANYVATRLKTLVSGLANIDTSGVSIFSTAIGDIGKAMQTFGKDVAKINIEKVTTAESTATRLKSLINSLANLNTSGVTSFKAAINELASVNISGIVKAFSGATAKMSSIGNNLIDGLVKGMRTRSSSVGTVASDLISSAAAKVKSKSSAFTIAGNELAMRLANGISSKKSSIDRAVSSCVSGASTKIRSNYNSFYSAGSYLVTGFANGISENAYKATAKAKAMAEAAAEAARKALRINSPSKVFREIGSGIPEGFAMGIGMLSSEVTGAVGSMASSAINTTRSAMTTVLDALNGDIDAQPTIRPVVDLSDVQTGADAINGLFNSAQTVGVQTNLRAIGSTMNAMSQNGKNDDVISAINKLRDKLDGVGNTYNTVNGITYDDGSNVTNAVETLVRYAKIGRRV